MEKINDTVYVNDDSKCCLIASGLAFLGCTEKRT